MRHERTLLVGGTILAIGVLGVSTRLGYVRIVENRRAESRAALETVLETSHQAIRSWVREERADAQIWAASTEIIQLTGELLRRPEHSALLTAPAQRRLRSLLSSVQRAKRYEGYFLIGPGNVNLSSTRDANIGMPNLLADQPEVLARLWNGETALSLPQRSDVPLPDSTGVERSGRVTMFVGAPIRDAADDVIALLTFRLDPSLDFTAIFQRGRIGRTGETYAFDRLGRLITESRFDEQLRRIGLIGSGERGILQVDVRDPGVNLVESQQTAVPRGEQPLTRMAASATAGERGFDVVGYRDYRGVPVVGAWLWDDEIGFGMTTEIDVADIYENLQLTGRSASVVTVLAMLLLVGVAVLFAVSRRQSLRLENTLAKVLSGYIPICAGCKKIRDDEGKWNEVEHYVASRTEAEFSHSICPKCGKELYGELYQEVTR